MDGMTSVQRGAPWIADGTGSPVGADRFPSSWTWILVTLLVGVLLAYAGREQILVANLEVGDMAANSILVQDAKSLSLWVGNYSRIGFNHPGPAILYVLAAGELVLHDWLHLVPSPLSGQLVAVALYSAFWITLLARLLRRSLPMRETAVGTAVFVLMAALCDHQFLGGLWFPHLYFFPFAVALLAFSRLAAGRTDSLVTLALACGFLINGHASFIATTGVMFACVVAYNFMAHWLEPGRCLLRRDFRSRHAGEIFLGIGVLALFLVPLAVMTIKEFPGPLAQYAHFGGGRDPIALISAVRFVSVYWGGVTGFVLGMFVCGSLFTRKAASGPGYPALRDTLAAIFAATFATLFYAKYGVDRLDQVYIALYYYAAPCLLAAILAVMLVRLVPAPWSSAGTVVVLALVVPATYLLAHNPPEYAGSYVQEGPRKVLDALEARKGSMRMVLDLNNSRDDWADVWTTLVGAKALGRRTGMDPFCIANRWHILFSKQGACTPAELQAGKRFIVTTVAASPMPGELFKAGGLSFQRRPFAPGDMGAISVRAQPDMFPSVLRSGWAPVEPELVWSVGHEATLALILLKGRRVTVLLDLQAYLPRETDRQELQVIAGGRVVADASFTSAAPRQIVEVELTDSTLASELRLRIAKPMAPRSVSKSRDARLLGVALYGIKVEMH